MDLRCRSSRGALAFCALTFLFAAGCSEAVLMSQESDQGGVVTYIFKQGRGGPMGSPYRRQALAAIEAKCKAGSRLVREGEVRGYTSAGMGTIEGTEDEERGRRWGIRFECKGSEQAREAADQSQSEPRRNP